MKTIFTSALLLLAFTILSFMDPPHVFTGRWQVTEKTPNGIVSFMVNFRKDETYDAYMNNKQFLYGKYHFKNDTLVIADHICDSRSFGIYKITFITPDSVLYSLVKDTCKARIEGTDHARLGRVKIKQ